MLSAVVIPLALAISYSKAQSRALWLLNQKVHMLKDCQAGRCLAYVANPL